jgi:hypothetical protein
LDGVLFIDVLEGDCLVVIGGLVLEPVCFGVALALVLETVSRRIDGVGASCLFFLVVDADALLLSTSFFPMGLPD